MAVLSRQLSSRSFEAPPQSLVRALLRLTPGIQELDAPGCRGLCFTTAVLGSIRNVKFLGLAEIMGAMTNALRVDELRASKKFRRAQTVRVGMVNLPTIAGQLATFTGYTIVARVQDTGGLKVWQAITSLALVNLLATALSNLLLAIPDTFVSMVVSIEYRAFSGNPIALVSSLNICPVLLVLQVDLCNKSR
ncbi:hypothetical protein BBP40_008727 [Aspergillus hancockii]|nr:hypothetical protein BBP40_008727 [Aspergillus hancockii]